MDRRAFITIVLGRSILAGPLAVDAQPAGKTPRVGVLRPGNPPPDDFRQREAFESGLRDLGWTPGTSILIEYRYGEGKEERLPELAGELGRPPVGVVVARATHCVRAVQPASSKDPDVFSAVPSPRQT